MDGPEAALARKVGAKGQVQLPPELMALLGIEPHQKVWIGINPERTGTLIVFPNELFNDLYRKGFRALSWRVDPLLRGTVLRMPTARWEFDLVLLLAVAELEDEGHFTLGSERVIARTGLAHDEVIAGTRRLVRGGYLDGKEVIGGGETFGDFLHLVLTERGLRSTGVWPSEDPYDSLLAALESRIKDTSDPDERSRLERLLEGARSLGKDVGTSVLTAWFRHMAGI